MRGHVLEIDCDDSDRAMRVLQRAKAEGRIPFDEVALYGVQIHAVVPDAKEYRPQVRRLLEDEGLRVNHIEWIAPTLEDVFISSVTAREGYD